MKTTSLKLSALASALILVGCGAPTTSNYSKMFLWSGNLFSDTFS
jgi:hypothetical protein